MPTRIDVISKAADECMKELYSYVVPKIDWKEFLTQCEEYNKKYKEWEKLNPRPNVKEYCGPKPYEFYYLPKEIMKSICDSYISAYRIDEKQEFLDNIETLKSYCKEPIVDKYIEGENGFPGHRGYEHPDNLEKEITKILPSNTDTIIIKEINNKFFEFLDMAGNFFDWNRNLNSFNMTVYLGASPNSNKEAVIENWKKYKNQDIVIDEEQIKKEYYGDDE